ncbi:type VI secretion system tip protein VgrG [Escherichia coli]|uniref:type VI secretion system tip protein VgrG n=1 Tax=Escherichia coli TaxID=562 RepID=UPI000BE15B4F
MENSAALLRRLNHYCARALEGAASLCQTRAHAEITPEHWLLKLLEQGEGDLTVLGRRYDWDMDAIWQSLLGWLDNLPRSVRSRPQLAQSLNALLKQAWMMASLQGEEHIRSVHLLGALTENPHLVRCDGLWPLLTLSQSQLQRLSPLLDAQSDECPETLQDAEPVLPQGDSVTFIGRPVGADIACDSLLLKPASFTFQTPVSDGTPALPIRTVFGVVESFRRVSASNDETRYALTIVPRIALLNYTKGSEIYLNQSVTEVVEQVLRKHGLEGQDFEFRLSREYPPRELITQWRETDLEFIRRLLAEVGIYWRYEMDSRLEQDIVIFQDSQQQYEFGITLPLRNQAGMSDSGQESIWDIQTTCNVVSGSVVTRDYNYREALKPQDSAESIFSKEGITTGETYHYAEPFLTAGDAESPETGAYFARLRHERILNAQYRVSGHSSSPYLTPGQVLETDGTLQEMVDNWQKSVRSRALPEEAMTGWNEGMTRLQQLAERLNRLDEQRGKYMTVSELKTEVFGIMQAFNRHIPAEEQLRRYDEVRNQNGSEQQQKQAEMALNQLINRYQVEHAGKPERQP